MTELRRPTGAREGTGDIQVVDRCAQVLRLFSSQQRSLRVAEVAVELGLQRSTVHRYMSSLTKAGFLERDADGLFRLGPLLVQLGTVALRGLRVLEIADPYAQTLANEAGETVVLAVWGGLGPVVARVHESADRLVNISVRIGSPLPIEAAQSQVFLAFLGDPSVQQRLVSRLPEIRQRELRDQLETVRRDGFIVSSEVVQGVRALAAPIFEGSGEICATVAVIGTVSGISDPPPSGLVLAILSVAERLSRELGFAGRLPFEGLMSSNKLIS
jgi:DNA-binding IclR family transcriptional regulator